MHLTVFHQMREIISSNMFNNAFTQDYHFFCLLCSVIFPRCSVGSIVTKFYRRLLLFGLILNRCTRIITALVFFTDFISRIIIYVCTCNIITICVVWKFPSLFSIDSVISLIDSNESSASGQSKSIFSLRFFNLNLGSTTKGGIVRVVL